jgi:uncharacterized membrane protein YeaQ/YmgE (transglycosylase-associated protein family)
MALPERTDGTHRGGLNRRQIRGARRAGTGYSDGLINLKKSDTTMMSILGTLFIGLIVGFIARAVKPGEDKLGWIMTALLGVAGSFVATYAGAAMGLYRQGDVAGFIASVIGAVILLFVYGLIKGKSA